MKKKLFLVVLAVMAIMMFAACASGGGSEAKESPDKDEAIALFDEATKLRTESLAAGHAESKGDFGRAESIYELGRIYIEKGMYTESLQPLGQARTYYSGYLGK